MGGLPVETGDTGDTSGDTSGDWWRAAVTAKGCTRFCPPSCPRSRPKPGTQFRARTAMTSMGYAAVFPLSPVSPLSGGREPLRATLLAPQDAQNVPDLRTCVRTEPSRDAGERSRSGLDLGGRGLEEAAVVAGTPPVHEQQRHVRDHLL